MIASCAILMRLAAITAKVNLMTRKSRSIGPLRFLVFAGMLLGIHSIAAQPISALQQLQAKVIERQRITNIPSTPEPFVDCSRTGVDDLERLSTGGALQYIYNAMYQWKSIYTPNGRCVYLVSPENRGLTSIEATALMTASGMEFPVPPEPPSSDANAVHVRPFGEDKMPVVDLSKQHN